jgi:hypothetical protein
MPKSVSLKMLGSKKLGQVTGSHERAAKERGYFEDANNSAAFYRTRKQNEADVKFCWK